MLAVVFSYILIVITVFGRALLPPYGQMIFGDDIHRQYYFFREFFNQWVSQGVFPWWNPYLFGGEPFIANPIVNIWYPPNWLYSLFPLNIAYSWHLALHVLWAMIGMYVLSSRKGQYTFNFAAWVSGVIFGLSGFFMARTFAGHVDVIAAASWMPWVVYTSIKAQTSHIKWKKNVIVAAGVFALQLLAGYQTMAFFTVIAVGFITLIQGVKDRNLQPFIRSGLAGMGGIGLAAFHLLPVQEFFRSSIRTYDLPYAWHSYGAIEWGSLIQLLNPFRFGNQFTYFGPPPNFIEHSMFVGIGGLILAIIGSSSIIRNRKGSGAAFLAIVVFGLWVSLGPNAPVDMQYILWKTVPMYQYLRIPSRHLILVVFGLAGLAGIGFSLTEKLFRLRKALIVLTGAVVVIEMVIFGRSFIELRPVPEIRHGKELIALLTQDSQPYRVLQNFGVWLPQRDVLDFDSVMPYGIYSATGYDPSMLRDYYEYIARSTGKSGEQGVLSQDVQVPYLGLRSAKVIDRLNIKYLMVPPDYDPFSGNDRYTLLRDDRKNNYRLYENTTALPRFYLSDRSCGSVAVSSYTPNRIELMVESTCDTNLLSSEVWYPGWEAYIDGKKTSINKTDNVFRTLFISPGNYTVVYRYTPRIFVMGGVISLCTVAGLAFWYRANITDAHRASKG